MGLRSCAMRSEILIVSLKNPALGPRRTVTNYVWTESAIGGLIWVTNARCERAERRRETLMLRRRSLHLLWVALVPILVFPLYGQTSCNRNCPAPSNPCQRSLGRSIETNQCVYADLDGVACDDQGVPGICSAGQCIASECTAEVSSYYGICDEPLDGGAVGACIDETCITSQPEDWCVKVGVGRINCCSPEGCRVANGAYCNAPLSGVSCDTAGIEPPGLGGQDGTCVNGACVALSGPCSGVECRTSYQDPCVRDYCDPAIGACADYPLQMQPDCIVANAPGTCHFGTCIPQNDLTCGGSSCRTTSSCKQANCRVPCLGPPNTCSGDCATQPWLCGVCEITNRTDGAPCKGEPGECFGGTCYPIISNCNDFVPTEDVPTPCNDYQECTDDVCCNTLDCRIGFCSNTPKLDGTPCAQSEFSGDYLGECQNGVCLPDLCIERNCSDGDPCTDDNCIAPWGSCENPTKANGEPCDGEVGECLFGSCQPVIPRCQRDSDCNDGNDCTTDTCPAGFCSFQGRPQGSTCTTPDGYSGQCAFGRCQPVILP